MWSRLCDDPDAHTPAILPTPYPDKEVSPRREKRSGRCWMPGRYSSRCIWRLPLLWFFCWTFAIFNYEQGAAEPTDWMKPAGLVG